MTDPANNHWAAHVAQLRNRPESKMLGISLAIAGELFLLKAENMRLRLALKQKGVMEDADDLTIAASDDFNKWLREEQSVFSRCIFKEWLTTDRAPDVSGEYESELLVQT